MLDEPFAASGLEFHLEFVVTQKTVSGILSQDTHQRITCWLGDFRRDEVGRGKRRVDVGRDEFLNTGCLKWHVSG